MLPDQAVVLLDGKPVTDFTFANGIFRTTSPLAWTTPSGEAASVHLHLQFSVFAGYGEAGFLSSYLGVQVRVLRASAGCTAEGRERSRQAAPFHCHAVQWCMGCLFGCACPRPHAFSLPDRAGAVLHGVGLCGCARPRTPASLRVRACRRPPGRLSSRKT